MKMKKNLFLLNLNHVGMVNPWRTFIQINLGMELTLEWSTIEKFDIIYNSC